MADYPIAKNGAAYIFYAALPSQANPLVMQANPTLAAGDFKVSIDGGALANLATLPTVTPAGSKGVKFSLSGAEMTGDNITIYASDAAGAEWCDQIFNIQTSARGIADLAFPNTSGRGMTVDAAGLVDANAVKVGPSGSGTTQTARDLGASVLLASGTGTGQLDFTSGVVKANLAQILGTALTETAGQIAAAFKKFFDKAAPTGTINSIPDAVAGAANGLLIAGSNAAATVNITGNLSGSVGSVTGSVGSVTAAVTVGTNNDKTGYTASTVTDKTGYALTTAYDPAKTAAQAGDAMVLTPTERTTLTAAIWAALTSGLTTAGSIGKRLVDFVTTLVYAAPLSAGQVENAVLDATASSHNTAGTIGNKINAAGGAADPLGNAVPGSYAAGQAGYVLGNLPSAAAVASQVDTTLSGTHGAGAWGAASSAVLYGESGSISCTFTVYDVAPNNTTPLPGVAVYVSSDSAGVHRSQTKLTDALGQVEFDLDSGTVYLWRSRSDRSFTNPLTETIS